MSFEFSYEVQGEDQDTDGISVGENAFGLDGERMSTAHGIPAILPLAQISNNPKHKVDRRTVVAPRVTSVNVYSRPQVGNAYSVGEVIEALVIFSQAVQVTGSPTLALTVGTATRLVPVQSRKSSPDGQTLFFDYMVQAEDADADGISILANALALNGATIRSKVGADASLDLGVHAISNDPEHKVNGSTVVAPRVTSVKVYSRPQEGTAYSVGEVIETLVIFSQAVQVTGSPTLALTVGTATRLVPVQSRKSSPDGQTLFFDYMVQAEDADADGISILANALALNGATIRSMAGADASLDLGVRAISNDPEHKVDGSTVAPPRVTSVKVYSRPQEGTAYGTGEAIKGSVAFSQVIQVTGSPSLTLTVGTKRVPLRTTNHQGTLFFDYTVQAGDVDADGISILVNALALNGATIRSTAGADASLDLGVHAISNDPEHKVDGSKVTPRRVRRVNIYSRPQDGNAYGPGEVIKASVAFSQAVQMTGSPTLALTVGTATKRVPLRSASRQGYLFFDYTVQAGDKDEDGISILANALALNGATIRSTAGTDADLDLGVHAISNNPEHKVDGSKVAPPRVRRVNIYSRPQEGNAYGPGEVIKVSVAFSQVVQVTGSPTLALTVGTATKRVPLRSTNRQGYLFFDYTVQVGDKDEDGISILANALTLRGGSIRSVAGPDAVLDLGSHAIVNDTEHRVDGSR